MLLVLARQAQPQRLGEAWNQPTLFLSPESLRAERISAGESIAVSIIVFFN